MRHILHRIICWYLRKCDGAFHCYPYGPDGRYVKLMTETEYANHAKMERVIREILVSHGMYGDGGNLDRLTRTKCLEILTSLDHERSQPHTSQIRPGPRGNPKTPMQVRDLIAELQRFDPRDEVVMLTPCVERRCPQCECNLKRYRVNEFEVDRVVREYGKTVIKVVE